MTRNRCLDDGSRERFSFSSPTRTSVSILAEPVIRPKWASTSLIGRAGNKTIISLVENGHVILVDPELVVDGHNLLIETWSKWLCCKDSFIIGREIGISIDLT